MESFAPAKPILANTKRRILVEHYSEPPKTYVQLTNVDKDDASARSPQKISGLSGNLSPRRESGSYLRSRQSFEYFNTEANGTVNPLCQQFVANVETDRARKQQGLEASTSLGPQPRVHSADLDEFLKQFEDAEPLQPSTDPAPVQHRSACVEAAWASHAEPDRSLQQANPVVNEKHESMQSLQQSRSAPASSGHQAQSQASESQYQAGARGWDAEDTYVPREPVSQTQQPLVLQAHLPERAEPQKPAEEVQSAEKKRQPQSEEIAGPPTPHAQGEQLQTITSVDSSLPLSFKSEEHWRGTRPQSGSTTERSSGSWEKVDSPRESFSAPDPYCADYAVL